MRVPQTQKGKQKCCCHNYTTCLIMHSDEYDSNEDEVDVAEHVHEEESVSEEPHINETSEVPGGSIVQLISRVYIRVNFRSKNSTGYLFCA